jgi:hypothetical protein
MDGTNSAGNRVSLLNDHDHHKAPLARLHSSTPSLRSRTSSYTTSYATSSVGSPPTPQLIRSHSSDSSMDGQTPSPITPAFTMENGLGSPTFSQPGFFNTHHHQQQQSPKDIDTPFPMMNMSYHSVQPVLPAYYAQQPPAPQQPAPASAATAAANGRPKKNQYPCPLAKQENCHDYFTTSGHAARHSKKHTGRKDAICPECNKAFTRKDNMEQHRRTHKGGRGNAKPAADRGAKKASVRAARPKISPTQTSTPVMSPTSLVDPALPVSPAGSFRGQSFIQPSAQGPDQFLEFAPRNYPDPTVYSMTGYPYHDAPPSYDHAGLDVLASAASDTRRFS